MEEIKDVAEQEKNEQNEEKENKTVSEENEKNEEKGKVKEKKKEEGFFKRTGKKFKKNKREIFSALGGLAAGISVTLGIEKLGEYFTNKKNMANAQDEQNVYYENNDDGTYNGD